MFRKVSLSALGILIIIAASISCYSEWKFAKTKTIEVRIVSPEGFVPMTPPPEQEQESQDNELNYDFG